jgi:hypothetical protein
MGNLPSSFVEISSCAHGAASSSALKFVDRLRVPKASAR